MRIWTNEKNFWDKKGIVVSQNNDAPSYNILNESVNIWARNQRLLIPITKKDDYHNAIVSNTSTHPNLMIDNQHEKPTLENVYRK